MNEPWVPVAACATVALLAVTACILVVRRSRADLEATRREAAELRERVDALAADVAAGVAARPSHQDRPEDEAGYLITRVGEDDEPSFVPARIEGRLFADIVLRETVVKAAALTHGVLRALTPENRNRIRFEMKREVRRSRKQRRADLKTARREWEARQRAVLAGDVAGDAAGEDAA